MNGGLLNESSLEKNIKQIVFFSKEEKASLNKICQKFEECLNSYKSDNSGLFFNNISGLKSDIDKIFEKRTKYTVILNKAINKYNALSEEVINIFNGDV